MNPLLKHHILRDLPYELIKNPDVDKIQEYLQRKRKVLRRIKVIVLICYPIALALLYFDSNVNYPNKGMETMSYISDIFTVISPIILLIMCHYLEKKIVLSNEEILNAINDVT